MKGDRSSRAIPPALSPLLGRLLAFVESDGELVQVKGRAVGVHGSVPDAGRRCRAGLRWVGRCDDGAASSAEQVGGLFEAADHGWFAGGFDEATGGVDLGSHGSGREQLAAQRLGCGTSDGAGGSGAEAGFDVVYVGEDQQGVGVEIPGEKGGGEVLVDDRLHAAEDSVRAAGDWDASTAGSR